MDNSTLTGLAYLMGTLEHYRALVMHPFTKGTDLAECIKDAAGRVPDAEAKVRRAYKMAYDDGHMPLRQMETARQNAKHGRLADYILILRTLGYSENNEIPL